MTDYQKRDIEQINKSLEFNRKILNEIEECHKTCSYSDIDSAVNEYKLKAKIAKQEDVLEVYKYALETIEKLSKETGKEVDGFNISSLLTFEFDAICGGNFRVYLCLNDDIHNKLYDYVFGSHSGIGEWVGDTVPVLLDPIVGSSDYCHAFGTFSMNSVMRFFKYFNEWYDQKNYNYDDSKKREEHVKKAKKIIDWLKGWSVSTDEVKTKFSEFYENYINLVLKANPEEDY